MLRDRKRFLRFLRAIMGEDGVVAIDAGSRSLWSRAALDAELAHDADPDVTAIYSVHAVQMQESEQATWLHTHGLDKAGAFDFDIVKAADELCNVACDALRAMAYAILEGDVRPDTPSFQLAHPGGLIGLVEAAEFQRRAPREDAAMRDELADHTDNRAVLCEPRSGLLGRWLRPVRRSRFLSGPVRDGCVFRFSNEATALMAERARGTVNVFAQLRDEFAEFELPGLVKLGYMTDGARSETDREHLWFTVDEIRSDGFVATLVNDPHAVSRLRNGDRGFHPLELLTDWTILTPAGPMTPRDLGPARKLRENLDRLRERMRRRSR